MLVRSNARMKEFAIRHSLGAGRWRVARQLLTESVALALMGGALGIAVAYGGVRLLSYLGARDLPRGANIQIDPGALAFTAAIALITGMLFGGVPLFQVLRRDLNAYSAATSARKPPRAAQSGCARRWWCASSPSPSCCSSERAAHHKLRPAASGGPWFQAGNVVTAQVGLPRVRYGMTPARGTSSPTCSSGCPRFRRALRWRDDVSAIQRQQQLQRRHDRGPRPRPGENPPVPGFNNATPAISRPCASR